VVVVDSKQYRGQLRVDRDGMVWHGRHLLVSALRRTLWEADQADEVLGIADVQVAAIVAVHGASIPWGALRAEGVTVVPARRLPDLLCALSRSLGRSGSPGWRIEPGCGSAPSPDRLPRQARTEQAAAQKPGTATSGPPSVRGSMTSPARTPPSSAR
jgi:hypothetical protein